MPRRWPIIRWCSPPNEVPGRRSAAAGACRWLRGRGHDAEHVTDIGLLSAPDEEIAAYAEAEGAVLISKDEDFIALRLPDRFALLWPRCGNATNAELTAWLEPRWEEIEGLLAAGERFIEAR